MVVLIHSFSKLDRPGLFIWRSGEQGNVLSPITDDRLTGWSSFRVNLDPQELTVVNYKLVGRDTEGRGTDWEDDQYNRELKRKPNTDFPAEVWIFKDIRRIVYTDPLTANPQNKVKIHLLTASLYRDAQLYVWDSENKNTLFVPTEPISFLGPIFEIDLTDTRQHFFFFKFAKNGTDFEPDIANRVFVADDGGEIWVHSEADIVRTRKPVLRELIIHLHKEAKTSEFPQIHLWQPGSGRIWDLLAEPEGDGWCVYRKHIFTDIDYSVKAHYARPDGDWWEGDQANRRITITDNTEYWTVEGSNVLFTSKPTRDLAITIQIAARPDGEEFVNPFHARVGIQGASDWAEADLPISSTNEIQFMTFRGIALKLDYYRTGSADPISSHTLDTPSQGDAFTGYAVLTKSTILREIPPTNLFTDPPFEIIRPGVWQQDGHLHFALHVLKTSRVRLVGEWITAPLDLLLTKDGTFFWARVPISTITDGIKAGNDNYHGAKYKYKLNDDKLIHDPAAHWVEGSGPGFWSKLFNPDQHQWRSNSWQRPGLDYLIIYQIHAARFSNRHSDLTPLLQVAREIDEQAGHLHDLGVTAIQLLPVNEVSSPIYGWGYDPSFFYAVEHNFGGPADLQELADTCHANGLALILDVEFNHTGNTDNILYATAQETFIDGDTEWGPLINFDNPICRFFFEQNVQYLAETFRIDGFRFDHTDTIINGHRKQNYVKIAGSGGGWEFLLKLRETLKRVDSRCFMIAEELPNDWYLTNHGSMDSQWCDDFHDRLLDNCSRKLGARIADLASAMQLTNVNCDDWYNATNYAESHDEVGNEDHRIAKVAQFGTGLRLAKVALTAVLLSRGIPHVFMGGEAGETQQFAKDKLDWLPLTEYRKDPNRKQVLAWFQMLCGLRRNDERIKGMSPLTVHFAQGNLLAFSRGGAHEFFMILNFNTWSGWRGLDSLNLPDGVYRELWNSSWPAFTIPGEGENEHTNGGRDAKLGRNQSVNIPDFGVIILQRI